MSDLPLTKPSAVLAAVADVYGVTTADLTTDRRVPRPGADARRVAARIIHDDCCWAWIRVATLMNRTADYTRRIAVRADPKMVELARGKLYNGNQEALW
jgi:hypothetical protein